MCSSDLRPKYARPMTRDRLLIGLAYFGLISVLAAGMAATFVADPTALQA